MSRNPALCHRNLIIALAAIFFAGAPAFAQDHEHAHEEDKPNLTTAAATAPAIKGDVYPLDECVVTGKKLGEAGEPVTHIHKGRDIKFCCKDCIKTFEADPAKYLKKIDEAVVKQQKPLYPMSTCLVSGEELGSMGAPVEFVYNNRLVRFCCGGCGKSFDKDPAKYLGKLDEAVIAQQKPGYPLDSCVVSGEKLGGSMGEPVDHVNGNRLVRFCCAGCARSFNDHPAQFTAKLDAAIIARDLKDYPLDTCVISGQKLGSMGKPVDHVYGTRLVRFCCNGCIGLLEKDPETALDKLNAAYKAKGLALPGPASASSDKPEKKAAPAAGDDHSSHEGHNH